MIWLVNQKPFPQVIDTRVYRGETVNTNYYLDKTNFEQDVKIKREVWWNRSKI